MFVKDSSLGELLDRIVVVTSEQLWRWSEDIGWKRRYFAWVKCHYM